MMATRRKAANLASGVNGDPVQCFSQHKCTEYSPLRQVRSLFLSGGKYTAKEVNATVGCNDGRKYISVLRHQGGLNIKSIWLDNPHVKLYWLENDGQLSLFGQL